MTCYYPLVGLPRGVVSSLTYSCHPLNRLAGRGEDRRPSAPLDLALYELRGDRWQCRERLPVPPEGDVRITSAEQGLRSGELLVAVPLAREEVPDAADPRLPLPRSKRLDRSPVAERCSLGFHWRGISSSYQGEYPLRMAEQERGTFVSFDPLLQAGAEVGINLVAFVTLSRTPDRSEHALESFDARSRRLRHRGTFRRNDCAVLEIDPAEAGAAEIFLRCTSTLGIPIYLTLSRDDAPASMSVEHTHPPTELFWEQDRLPGSRAIKRTWLGAVLS
jgi:hypothetical protein